MQIHVRVQVIVLAICFWCAGCTAQRHIAERDSTMVKDAEALLRSQVLDEAGWAMLQEPVTITAGHSPRSAGGVHDFFSEADYFWPIPKIRMGHT